MLSSIVSRCSSVVLGTGIGAALFLANPPSAQAFCAFYVAGADADLHANATMVVFMPDGARTVLSMRNDYAGPPEDFAMVIPVPVVLSENEVRPLDPALFDRVDKLSAPRLVEYWEQDPCKPGFGIGGLALAPAFSLRQGEPSRCRSAPG